MDGDNLLAILTRCKRAHNVSTLVTGSFFMIAPYSSDRVAAWFPKLALQSYRIHFGDNPATVTAHQIVSGSAQDALMLSVFNIPGIIQGPIWAIADGSGFDLRWSEGFAPP